MSRYKLPIDKLVNRLVPHYLAGRRFILFVQSALYPLQNINEWFLNYKFSKYFKDSRDRIFIKESESVGVDLYHENAEYMRPCTVWYNGESITATSEDEQPRPFYRYVEEKLINKVSFMVCVPPIKIPPQDLVYMLSYVVNTYKIAGKTYLIKIDEEEYEPNKNTK